jgi:hypothetical protein
VPDPSPPRRRSLRLLLLLLVLTPLLFLGVAVLFVVRARHIPPDIPPDTSPAAVARAERQMGVVKQELEAARRDARTGRARPYHVEVRTDDVNTLLRADPRLRKSLQRRNVTRPRVEVRNGRLRAGALVSLRGRRVYVTAEGVATPGAKGGITFRPEKIWLGDARAPTAVTREIARRIDRALQSGELQLPGRVRAVRLENGRIVIEGDTAPAAPTRSPGI